MHDPYIDELKKEFDDLYDHLKKLKKKLLKAKSMETQSKIIKQVDSIAKKWKTIKNNQLK
ncbi:MAG: hypothetical protein OEQ94_00930 [Nitrosopumilus sp.]|nr:hypothetical protein [Nitrosopumilus sp.]